MELTYEGKRYKSIVISAMDSILEDNVNFSEDGTKYIIDYRTVKPENIVTKLTLFCQLIRSSKVSYVWLNCSQAKFLEIKERLRKLLKESGDTTAMSTDLTILKLSTHEQSLPNDEALKLSIDVLNVGKSLLDIHRLMDAHPGLLKGKFHLNSSLKRKRLKRQDGGGMSANNDSAVALTAPYSDKRRPSKSVFKALKQMTKGASNDTNRSKCYMCNSKGSFHSLCDECHELNGDMKRVSCDLKGRYAIVTGGRIKIGFETSLRLLRDGCFVVVTTRFPVNAAERFSKESDFDVWKHRLKIARLELQDMRSIEEFLVYVQQNIPHLDILINNAAQTIYRPFQYYESLMSDEVKHLPSLSKDANNLLVSKNQEQLVQSHSMISSPTKSALPRRANSSEFPDNQKDEHGEQLDIRLRNSWTYNLDEVPLQELLQVLMHFYISVFYYSD